jgi:nitroreductase
MEFEDVVHKRRALRALEKVKITDDMVKKMVRSAGLSASCFNKQPWRFVFVRDEHVLRRLFGSLSRGNKWAERASMIVAVVSHRDLDCVVGEREYYLFDTGMATALLILKATEMGLVAHPIAGFDEDKAREVLTVPAEMRLITLIIFGKHADNPEELLDEKQLEREHFRPQRLDLPDIMFLDGYSSSSSMSSE